jgi:hypothetical protein
MILDRYPATAIAIETAGLVSCLQSIEDPADETILPYNASKNLSTSTW